MITACQYSLCYERRARPTSRCVKNVCLKINFVKIFIKARILFPILSIEKWKMHHFLQDWCYTKLILPQIATSSSKKKQNICGELMHISLAVSTSSLVQTSIGINRRTSTSIIRREILMEGQITFTWMKAIINGFSLLKYAETKICFERFRSYNY